MSERQRFTLQPPPPQKQFVPLVRPHSQLREAQEQWSLFRYVRRGRSQIVVHPTDQEQMGGSLINSDCVLGVLNIQPHRHFIEMERIGGTRY